MTSPGVAAQGWTRGEPRWLRSQLFVAGHRGDHLAKAYATAADAVVIDLEDAVAPQRKDLARETVVEHLRTAPSKPTVVRVNAVVSELGWVDLEAVATAPLHAVRLPKTESAQLVREVGDHLDRAGSPAGIQLLLESALGVERAFDLATAHHRVVGISLGEHDLKADLGASSDEGMLYSRSRAIVAARAAGLVPPHQGTWPRLDDLDGLRESTARGKRLGFFGRSALHPKQVDTINEVYTPTARELQEAQDLADALARGVEAGDGAVKLPDGRFVDGAVVHAARRTLALAARQQAPGGNDGSVV